MHVLPAPFVFPYKQDTSVTRQVLRILPIALIVMTPGLTPQTSVQTAPIYLAAGDLSLTFSGRTGVLVSALDSRTGTDLIRSGDDDHGGGWRLVLESPDGRKAFTELADAGSFESLPSQPNGQQALTLQWRGLKLSDGSSLPAARVTTVITASPGDSSSLWRFSAEGLDPWSIVLADCIDIRNVGSIGDRTPARLFLPEGAGRIYHDPARSLPAATWLYPSQASMQFMAIYGDSAGFSITARDTAGELKAGSWKGESPAAPASRVTFTHIFRSPAVGAATVPYAVQLGVFHGDWQTAAAAYRAFAESAPWTRQAARRATALDDTFQTMAVPVNTGPAQREALGELEKRAQSQVTAWGAPVLVSLGDWAQLRSPSAALGTAPQMGWASLEASLRLLRRSGISAVAELSGYCTETGVAMPEPGARIYPDETPCAAMKIASPAWRNRLGSLVSLLRNRGITIFALDLWPETHLSPDSPELRRNDIFRPSAWRTLLSSLAGDGRPDAPFLGAKQPFELFLPQLRFFRTRTCNVPPGWPESRTAPVEEVPAFDFVYHAWTAIECDTQPRSAANAAGRLLTVARAFVTGQRIVSAVAAPDSEDFQLFLKNSTLARRGFAQSFLAGGTMLPDAAIEAPLAGREEFENSPSLPDAGVVAVQSGVWRAKNGDVGVALANVSRHPASVRVPIDFDRWGLHTGRDYTLRAVSDRGPVPLAGGVRDSTSVSVSVETLDVAVITIHEELVTGGGIERIVNAARAEEPCGVAPGEVVDISGVFGGPDRASSADLSHGGPYPLELDETAVSFDGARGAILMASPSLVRAIVPWTVAGRSSVSVQVRRRGVSSGLISEPVQPACPGVYPADSVGSALVRNDDGNLNSGQRPAARGSVIAIYATGLGVAGMQPRAGESFEGSGSVLRPVSVTIDGVPARVRYAGFSQNIFSGVYEIQVRVPDSIQPGRPRLLVTANGQQSIGLNIVVD